MNQQINFLKKKIKFPKLQPQFNTFLSTIIVRKVLFVIDYQFDFVKGKLPIDYADKIAKRIQELINDDSYDLIIYTFDTHNKKTYAKTKEGKVYPFHCEFRTEGWWFYDIKPLTDQAKQVFNSVGQPVDFNIGKELFFCKDKFSIVKGNKFFANFVQKYIPLDAKIDICGVAEDVCVKGAGVGLVKLGYQNVNVIKDATEGIKKLPDGKINPGYQEAIDKMTKNNIKFI